MYVAEIGELVLIPSNLLSSTSTPPLPMDGLRPPYFIPAEVMGIRRNRVVVRTATNEGVYAELLVSPIDMVDGYSNITSEEEEEEDDESLEETDASFPHIPPLDTSSEKALLIYRETFLLIEEEQWSEAKKALKTIFHCSADQLHPLRAMLILTDLLVELGDFEEALSLLQSKEVEVHHSLPSIRLRIAKAHYHLHNASASLPWLLEQRNAKEAGVGLEILLYTLLCLEDCSRFHSEEYSNTLKYLFSLRFDSEKNGDFVSSIDQCCLYAQLSTHLLLLPRAYPSDATYGGDFFIYAAEACLRCINSLPAMSAKEDQANIPHDALQLAYSNLATLLSTYGSHCSFDGPPLFRYPLLDRRASAHAGNIPLKFSTRIRLRYFRPDVI